MTRLLVLALFGWLICACCAQAHDLAALPLGCQIGLSVLAPKLNVELYGAVMTVVHAAQQSGSVAELCSLDPNWHAMRPETVCSIFVPLGEANLLDLAEKLVGQNVRIAQCFTPVRTTTSLPDYIFKAGATPLCAGLAVSSNLSVVQQLARCTSAELYK